MEMEFWFHCNNCYSSPGNRSLIGSFHLTTCGHILCNECVRDTDTLKVCKICNRTEITTHKIDGTLPPDVQEFFLPPSVLIQRAQKRIMDTITFQQNQKTLIERRLIKKIVDLWKQLQSSKQNSEAKKQLEMEITSLRNGLKSLKGELERTINQHQEYEKHALQWGFQKLFPRGNGQGSSKEPDTPQLNIEDILAGNGDKQLDISMLTNDTSSTSLNSDEPPRASPPGGKSTSSPPKLDLASLGVPPVSSIADILYPRKANRETGTSLADVLYPRKANREIGSNLADILYPRKANRETGTSIADILYPRDANREIGKQEPTGRMNQMNTNFYGSLLGAGSGLDRPRYRPAPYYQHTADPKFGYREMPPNIAYPMILLQRQRLYAMNATAENNKNEDKKEGSDSEYPPAE